MTFLYTLIFSPCTSPPFSAPSSSFLLFSQYPIRMAVPSTLLSSHHFPKNFALWLPILSSALFIFSPRPGSFSHSHYRLLSKPTKQDSYLHPLPCYVFPFTARLSEKNCLSILSSLLHLPIAPQATPPPAHQTWAFSGFKLRCPLQLSAVEKQVNSTNKSCLPLTLLFLLIFSSIFSPSVYNRECVSMYVWW